MKAIVTKWGNSLAIRLPQSVTKQLQLKEGSTVELDSTDEAIVITKPKLVLRELLATYDTQETEEDWGQPQGREVW